MENLIEEFGDDVTPLIKGMSPEAVCNVMSYLGVTGNVVNRGGLVWLTEIESIQVVFDDGRATAAAVW